MRGGGGGVRGGYNYIFFFWRLTWFLTGVTTPLSRQSIAGGGVLLVGSRPLVGMWVAEQFWKQRGTLTKPQGNRQGIAIITCGAAR